MSDVFINYARDDNTIARAIHRELEAVGISVWRDEFALQPGMEFLPLIQEVIGSAVCLLTIWTPRSVKSNWVRAEAELAFRTNKIFPLAIGIDPSRLPPPFNAVHTEFWDTRDADRDDRLARLVQNVQRYISEHRRQPKQPFTQNIVVQTTPGRGRQVAAQVIKTIDSDNVLRKEPRAASDIELKADSEPLEVHAGDKVKAGTKPDVEETTGGKTVKWIFIESLDGKKKGYVAASNLIDGDVPASAGFVPLPLEIGHKDDASAVRSPKKAFISHADFDEETAFSLVEYLENANCPCWIAVRDVEPGDDYRGAIVKALSEVRFFVLLYSQHVNPSFDVANELLLARKKGKTRLFLRTDDSEPSGPIEYELANVQWIDYRTDKEAAFERLARRARAL